MLRTITFSQLGRSEPSIYWDFSLSVFHYFFTIFFSTQIAAFFVFEKFLGIAVSELNDRGGYRAVYDITLHGS